MTLTATLFTHMLNEALLLPCWLTHHRKLFTHGVLLDCGSSDDSVAIVKRMCPTWEVVHLDQSQRTVNVSENRMHELEVKNPGWKMVLNVSEFLLVPHGDMQQYLKNFERQHPNRRGTRATGVILVDRPGDTGLDTFEGDNWFNKKARWGYLEAGQAWSGNWTPPFEIQPNVTYRNRLLHRAEHGHYGPGRHHTYMSEANEIDPTLFVGWIGRGSPLLTDHRGRQWQERERAQGHNVYPPLDCFRWMIHPETMQLFWENEMKKSGELVDTVPNYKEALEVQQG